MKPFVIDGIEFTDQRPRTPGLYCYVQPNYEPGYYQAVVVVRDTEVPTTLYACENGRRLNVALFLGLWSKPYTLVDAVEKAWDEGYDAGASGKDTLQAWSKSRAKRVVEGTL